MSNRILFVFEGRKTEPRITDNLTKYFINDGHKTLIRASYGHNMYKLYDHVKADDGLNLFDIIKEEIEKRDVISEQDREILGLKSIDVFSDIYLFFDYDCHCSNADDGELIDMLSFFNDSMENGLLSVSYPMIEAVRHLDCSENFEKLFSTDNLLEYKKFVLRPENGDLLFRNWGGFDLLIWSKIIDANLRRSNYLIEGVLSLPALPIEQTDIFNAQLAKHIPNKEIAVIFSFPLMLHYHYGGEIFGKLITE